MPEDRKEEQALALPAITRMWFHTNLAGQGLPSKSLRSVHTPAPHSTLGPCLYSQPTSREHPAGTAPWAYACAGPYSAQQARRGPSLLSVSSHLKPILMHTYGEVENTIVILLEQDVNSQKNTYFNFALILPSFSYHNLFLSYSGFFFFPET